VGFHWDNSWHPPSFVESLVSFSNFQIHKRHFDLNLSHMIYRFCLSYPSSLNLPLDSPFSNYCFLSCSFRHALTVHLSDALLFVHSDATFGDFWAQYLC